jgi:hypothetical protein
MASSTSPLPVQPVAELAAEVVVAVAQQRLLPGARQLHLQVERLLFPLALQRPQAEDVAEPVVVADAGVPLQQVRSRLKRAC